MSRLVEGRRFEDVKAGWLKRGRGGWGMTEGKAVGECRHPHPQSSRHNDKPAEEEERVITTGALNRIR